MQNSETFESSSVRKLVNFFTLRKYKYFPLSIYELLDKIVVRKRSFHLPTDFTLLSHFSREPPFFPPSDSNINLKGSFSVLLPWIHWEMLDSVCLFLDDFWFHSTSIWNWESSTSARKEKRKKPKEKTRLVLTLEDLNSGFWPFFCSDILDKRNPLY